MSTPAGQSPTLDLAALTSAARDAADTAGTGDWRAYFTVHGDPSLVTDERRPAFTTLAEVNTGLPDYGRAVNQYLGLANPDTVLALIALLERTIQERDQALERSDTPVPCEMVHQEPFDFAECSAHDTTFPLGGTCKFDGRASVAEVYAEEADAQRVRAVRAEMEVEALRATPRTARVGSSES